MAARAFKKGDCVLVTPKVDDAFQNEFVGTITGTHDKYWTVVDGEGDAWDCDEDQIQHEEY